MTIQKLASLIAKAEGKKHQASVGDVREILAIVSDLCLDPRILMILLYSGLQRQQKHILKKTKKK